MRGRLGSVMLPALGLAAGLALAANLTAASGTSLALSADAGSSIRTPWQAAFSPPPVAVPLEVVIAGIGGTVTSNVTGISCTVSPGPGCRAGFDEGSTVTLTASSSSVTWYGCSSSSGDTCDVLMTRSPAPVITAEFY